MNERPPSQTFHSSPRARIVLLSIRIRKRVLEALGGTERRLKGEMHAVGNTLSTQMAASDKASRQHVSAVQRQLEKRHDQSEVLLNTISNKQDKNAEALSALTGAVSTLTDQLEKVSTAQKQLLVLSEKEREERTANPKALFEQPRADSDATSDHVPAPTPAPVTVIDACSVGTPVASSSSVATTAESSASSVSTVAAVSSSSSLPRRTSSRLSSKSKIVQLEQENKVLELDNKSKEGELNLLKRPNDSAYCTPAKKAKQQRRAVDHEQKHKERMFEARLTRAQTAAQRMGSSVVPPQKRRGV